jgi:hypothetical protein
LANNGEGCRHRPGDGRFVAHIARKCHGLPAETFDLGNGGLITVLGARPDCHLRSCAGQPASHPQADAAVAARHNRNVSGKVESVHESQAS